MKIPLYVSGFPGCRVTYYLWIKKTFSQPSTSKAESVGKGEIRAEQRRRGHPMPHAQGNPSDWSLENLS